MAETTNKFLNLLKQKEKIIEENQNLDIDLNLLRKRSEKRAWMVAWCAVGLCLLMGGAIATLVPLHKVEPYVIKVDQSTGMVDLVSVFKEQDIDASEALNKYWLNKYVLHRESYLFETREYDRKIVGLLSERKIQQIYNEYSNPDKNKDAPVAIYKDNARVNVDVKHISMLGEGEQIGNEKRYTALVRYTKQVSRQGEYSEITHWVATIVFVYRATPMKFEDRKENPLGFQVVNYRNDPETAGN